MWWWYEYHGRDDPVARQLAIKEAEKFTPGAQEKTAATSTGETLPGCCGGSLAIPGD
jgi:hypothetical protein